MKLAWSLVLFIVAQSHLLVAHIDDTSSEEELTPIVVRLPKKTAKSHIAHEGSAEETGKQTRTRAAQSHTKRNEKRTSLQRSEEDSKSTRTRLTSSILQNVAKNMESVPGRTPSPGNEREAMKSSRTDETILVTDTTEDSVIYSDSLSDGVIREETTEGQGRSIRHSDSLSDRVVSEETTNTSETALNYSASLPVQKKTGTSLGHSESLSDRVASKEAANFAENSLDHSDSSFDRVVSRDTTESSDIHSDSLSDQILPTETTDGPESLLSNSESLSDRLVPSNASKKEESLLEHSSVLNKGVLMKTSNTSNSYQKHSDSLSHRAVSKESTNKLKSSINHSDSLSDQSVQKETFDKSESLKSYSNPLLDQALLKETKTIPGSKFIHSVSSLEGEHKTNEENIEETRHSNHTELTEETFDKTVHAEQVGELAGTDRARQHTERESIAQNSHLKVSEKENRTATLEASKVEVLKQSDSIKKRPPTDINEEETEITDSSTYTTEQAEDRAQLELKTGSRNVTNQISKESHRYVKIKQQNEVSKVDESASTTHFSEESTGSVPTDTVYSDYDNQYTPEDAATPKEKQEPKESPEQTASPEHLSKSKQSAKMSGSIEEKVSSEHVESKLKENLHGFRNESSVFVNGSKQLEALGISKSAEKQNSFEEKVNTSGTYSASNQSETERQVQEDKRNPDYHYDPSPNEENDNSEDYEDQSYNYEKMMKTGYVGIPSSLLYNGEDLEKYPYVSHFPQKYSNWDVHQGFGIAKEGSEAEYFNPTMDNADLQSDAAPDNGNMFSVSPLSMEGATNAYEFRNHSKFVTANPNLWRSTEQSSEHMTEDVTIPYMDIIQQTGLQTDMVEQKEPSKIIEGSETSYEDIITTTESYDLTSEGSSIRKIINKDSQLSKLALKVGTVHTETEKNERYELVPFKTEENVEANKEVHKVSEESIKPGMELKSSDARDYNTFNQETEYGGKSTFEKIELNKFSQLQSDSASQYKESKEKQRLTEQYISGMHKEPEKPIDEGIGLQYTELYESSSEFQTERMTTPARVTKELGIQARATPAEIYEHEESKKQYLTTQAQNSLETTTKKVDMVLENKYELDVNKQRGLTLEVGVKPTTEKEFENTGKESIEEIYSDVSFEQQVVPDDQPIMKDTHEEGNVPISESDQVEGNPKERKELSEESHKILYQSKTTPRIDMSDSLIASSKEHEVGTEIPSETTKALKFITGNQDKGWGHEVTTDEESYVQTDVTIGNAYNDMQISQPSGFEKVVGSDTLKITTPSMIPGSSFEHEETVKSDINAKVKPYVEKGKNHDVHSSMDINHLREGREYNENISEQSRISGKQRKKIFTGETHVKLENKDTNEEKIREIIHGPKAESEYEKDVENYTLRKEGEIIVTTILPENVDIYGEKNKLVHVQSDATSGNESLKQSGNITNDKITLAETVLKSKADTGVPLKINLEGEELIDNTFEKDSKFDKHTGKEAVMKSGRATKIMDILKSADSMNALVSSVQTNNLVEHNQEFTGKPFAAESNELHNEEMESIPTNYATESELRYSSGIQSDAASKVDRFKESPVEPNELIESIEKDSNDKDSKTNYLPVYEPLLNKFEEREKIASTFTIPEREPINSAGIEYVQPVVTSDIDHTYEGAKQPSKINVEEKGQPLNYPNMIPALQTDVRKPQEKEMNEVSSSEGGPPTINKNGRPDTHSEVHSQEEAPQDISKLRENTLGAVYPDRESSIYEEHKFQYVDKNDSAHSTVRSKEEISHDSSKPRQTIVDMGHSGRESGSYGGLKALSTDKNKKFTVHSSGHSQEASDDNSMQGEYAIDAIIPERESSSSEGLKSLGLDKNEKTSAHPDEHSLEETASGVSKPKAVGEEYSDRESSSYEGLSSPGTEKNGRVHSDGQSQKPNTSYSTSQGDNDRESDSHRRSRTPFTDKTDISGIHLTGPSPEEISSDISKSREKNVGTVNYDRESGSYEGFRKPGVDDTDSTKSGGPSHEEISSGNSKSREKIVDTVNLETEPGSYVGSRAPSGEKIDTFSMQSGGRSQEAAASLNSESKQVIQDVVSPDRESSGYSSPLKEGIYKVKEQRQPLNTFLLTQEPPSSYTSRTRSEEESTIGIKEAERVSKSDDNEIYSDYSAEKFKDLDKQTEENEPYIAEDLHPETTSYVQPGLISDETLKIYYMNRQKEGATAQPDFFISQVGEKDVGREISKVPDTSKSVGISSLHSLDSHLRKENIDTVTKELSSSDESKLHSYASASKEQKHSVYDHGGPSSDQSQIAPEYNKPKMEKYFREEQHLKDVARYTGVSREHHEQSPVQSQSVQSGRTNEAMQLQENNILSQHTPIKSESIEKPEFDSPERSDSFTKVSEEHAEIKNDLRNVQESDTKLPTKYLPRKETYVGKELHFGAGGKEQLEKQTKFYPGSVKHTGIIENEGVPTSKSADIDETIGPVRPIYEKGIEHYGSGSNIVSEEAGKPESSRIQSDSDTIVNGKGGFVSHVMPQGSPVSGHVSGSSFPELPGSNFEGKPNNKIEETQLDEEKRKDNYLVAGHERHPTNETSVTEPSSWKTTFEASMSPIMNEWNPSNIHEAVSEKSSVLSDSLKGKISADEASGYNKMVTHPESDQNTNYQTVSSFPWENKTDTNLSFQQANASNDRYVVSKPVTLDDKSSPPRKKIRIQKVGGESNSNIRGTDSVVDYVKNTNRTISREESISEVPVKDFIKSNIQESSTNRSTTSKEQKVSTIKTSDSKIKSKEAKVTLKTKPTKKPDKPKTAGESKKVRVSPTTKKPGKSSNVSVMKKKVTVSDKQEKSKFIKPNSARKATVQVAKVPIDRTKIQDNRSKVAEKEGRVKTETINSTQQRTTPATYENEEAEDETQVTSMQAFEEGGTKEESTALKEDEEEIETVAQQLLKTGIAISGDNSGQTTLKQVASIEKEYETDEGGELKESGGDWDQLKESTESEPSLEGGKTIFELNIYDTEGTIEGLNAEEIAQVESKEQAGMESYEGREERFKKKRRDKLQRKSTRRGRQPRKQTYGWKKIAFEEWNVEDDSGSFHTWNSEDHVHGSSEATSDELAEHIRTKKFREDMERKYKRKEEQIRRENRHIHGRTRKKLLMEDLFHIDDDGHSGDVEQTRELTSSEEELAEYEKQHANSRTFRI